MRLKFPETAVRARADPGIGPCLHAVKKDVMGVEVRHGAPTHNAMAAATSSSKATETIPSGRTKRANDTDFVWNASAPESLLNPLLLSAGINTNHGNKAYDASSPLTVRPFAAANDQWNPSSRSTPAAPSESLLQRPDRSLPTTLHRGWDSALWTYKSSLPNASKAVRLMSFSYSSTASAAAAASIASRCSAGSRRNSAALQRRVVSLNEAGMGVPCVTHVSFYR